MAAPPPVIDISSSASTQKPPASSHRLPTVSASEALLGLNSNGKAAISSGLEAVNHALVGSTQVSNGGFERGRVAEIWGPSGSGKTALAFQTASEAIKTGGSVAWIDAAAPLSASRLHTLSNIQPDPSNGRGATAEEQSVLDRFRHISVLTFSHLLALILHPPASFPPQNSTLLVIDNIQKLVDIDFPRMPFGNGARSEQQKWQAGRRYAILGTFVTALSKLAVLNNMAVIVTTGCSSRMRTDSGLAAAIGPGIGGSEWEGGIWSRIVLFRDFNGRFAGMQKCNGRNITPLDPVGDVRHAIGFEISGEGWLKEQVIDLTSSASDRSKVQQVKVSSSPTKAVRKRQYEEIADSDEDADEYGWAETDDAIAGAGLADEHKPANVEQQQQPT